MMAGPPATEVAIVGGGPAGAATAIRLARAGVGVVLLEAAPAARWRACGVFTSPATMAALRGLGFDDATLSDVARPIPAMRVESRAAVAFRLTYGGTGALGDSAVGLSRPRFDELLLEAARAAGADVRRGARVRRLDRDRGTGWTIDVTGGSPLRSRLVVGADGARSTVAASVGATSRPRFASRVGLTFHIADPEPDRGHDARIVVLRDGYVGLAPVPGGRLNVGIVLGRSWFGRLRTTAPAVLAGHILRSLPDRGSGGPMILDRVAGAAPLAHAVTRRAGPGWLLVGDAAGFLDPFTGEGLHRSLASAELAASAILDARPDLSGQSRRRDAAAAAGRRYERAARAMFRHRDLVTRIIDAFLSNAGLFEYAARRLAARAGPCETMGLVIGDLLPAHRALDPRFLAAVLRP